MSAFMGREDSFWAKYGFRSIAYIVGIGLFVLLALAAAGSCATTAKNTEVAIIVNNVTGSISLLENGGMVLHLPFGLSSVYIVDKSQRVLSLTKASRTPEHPQGDQVNIKTNDGSNVEIDMEVVYQIKSSRAADAYRELGNEKNIEDIMRALTRSEIRSEFGELTTIAIAEAVSRQSKIDSTQKKLAAQVEPMGIEIVSVNAKNFHFDPEYDKIIRDRKEADQILTNQKDYQDAAIEEGKRMVAESTRDKQTALAQLQGELSKRLIVAEGEVKRMRTKAGQQAYQIEKEINPPAMISGAEGEANRIKTKAAQQAYLYEREGDTAFQTGAQEASAILAEGQRKAEGMEKLLEAYENGGEGLVREALSKLYGNVTIRARPYAVSDKIEQVQLAPAIQQAVPAGK